MVRIAGIDKDFTELELIFHMATEEEKLKLAANYLATAASQVGDFELMGDLEDGTEVIITAKIKKK